MIDALHIWQRAVLDAGYEYIPFLVNVTDEIGDQRRKRYSEALQVSTCEEKEAVNDQKGRQMSDHGRCPWYSVA